MFAVSIRTAYAVLKFPCAGRPPPNEGTAPVICRIDPGIRRGQYLGVEALGVDPCDFPQLPDTGRAAMAGDFQTNTRPKSAFELVQVFNHAAPSFPCPGHTGQNSVPG